jgi:hypothetical protein
MKKKNGKKTPSVEIHIHLNEQPEKKSGQTRRKVGQWLRSLLKFVASIVVKSLMMPDGGI